MLDSNPLGHTFSNLDFVPTFFSASKKFLSLMSHFRGFYILACDSFEQTRKMFILKFIETKNGYITYYYCFTLLALGSSNGFAEQDGEPRSKDPSSVAASSRFCDSSEKDCSGQSEVSLNQA